MGCLFAKKRTISQFEHLKPHDNESNILHNELSPEQHHLYSQLLQLIDTNFNIQLDSLTALKESNGAFPSKITENIFIGGHRSASNVNIYNNKLYIGITHVVNCAADEFLKEYPVNVNVLKVSASDEEKYRIIDNHINDIIRFVDNALESNDNKVLFHCLAGVNRSVSLCIAFMIYKYKETKNITEIVDLVSTQRRIGILSNVAFVKQLVQYNSTLHHEQNNY